MDLLEARPKFRQKITDVSMKFEKALHEMTSNHINIDGKLGVLEQFMTTYNQKFTFFQSLIEDKKNLEVKCESLQVRTEIQSVHSEKELIKLKEQLARITNELEQKSVTLKNYEEMHKKLAMKKKGEKYSSETEGKNKLLIHIFL